jgi:phosphoglycolate phosphatase-like HAD superfamily hydrolase
MQEKTHIIWDLSGTLFKPQNTGYSDQQLADLSLLFYMWSGKKEPSKLDNFALKILNAAEEPQPQYEIVRLHNGDPVPAIECSLLAGFIDSAEACQKTMAAIEKVQNESLTKEELVQICRMLKTFFNPAALAACMEPISETHHVVSRCAQNPRNTLYGLSNWDRESFDLLYKTPRGTRGFHHFKRKHVLISADVGYIKPQPEIYEFFLSHHKLEPSTCFFVDDQEENIAAAKTFGIDGMKFIDNGTDELEKKLIDLQILQAPE